MSRDSAKQFYDRRPGDSSRSFISASDAKNAIDVIYDDMPTGGMPGTLVTAHGAIGDGLVDDTDAIEEAILAAGVGGVVQFPPGTYRVSRTLWPLNAQTWRGDHNPKYTHDSNPGSSCVLMADPTFTGRALIERASGTYGVHFSHLCLLGNGDEAPEELHGLHLGDMSAERAWKAQDVRGTAKRSPGTRRHQRHRRDPEGSDQGHRCRVYGLR